MKALSSLSLSTLFEIKEKMDMDLYWKRDKFDKEELRLVLILKYVEAVENYSHTKYYGNYGADHKNLEKLQDRINSIEAFYNDMFSERELEKDIKKYLWKEGFTG